jgi:hypothetical protein
MTSWQTLLKIDFFLFSFCTANFYSSHGRQFRVITVALSKMEEDEFSYDPSVAENPEQLISRRIMVQDLGPGRVLSFNRASWGLFFDSTHIVEIDFKGVLGIREVLLKRRKGLFGDFNGGLPFRLMVRLVPVGSVQVGALSTFTFSELPSY